MAARNVTRIAFYIPSLRGDGAERVTVTLAQALAQRGLAVDMVLAKAEGAFLAEAGEVARIIDLGARRVLASLPRLVAYLRRERPDALVSVMAHANIVALWARSLARVSTRLIIAEHSTAARPAVATSKLPGPAALFNRFYSWPELKRDFYGWADGIVAVSEAVADQLSKTGRLPRDRITVIYNPIVSPQLTKKAQLSLNDPWFAPNEPPVVLTAGRLVTSKDHVTLIGAFALLREHCEARLLILGEGEEREYLQALVRDLGLEPHVRMPGWVGNPYAYMARAAVFVLSSIWEGLPTALIEAMACGCPVVSTNCPGGSAEVLDGGRFGRLVPVGDAHAMAAAIASAIREGRGDASRRAQERAFEFNLERATDAYCTLLFPSDGADVRRRSSSRDLAGDSPPSQEPKNAGPQLLSPAPAVERQSMTSSRPLI